MTLIRNLMLAFVGLAAGATVSSGIFAFITMLGVVPRLASKTITAKHVYFYEICIILGGSLGNVFTIYEFKLPVYGVGLALFGLFAGIFVGCLAMALAETLKVIPIFVMRTKLTQGMPFIVVAIALGKAIGSFYQLFINWAK